ncbi:hypothetical protein [uncultured Bacteroides sp.]|uniref:hypothetical protein n=1 Tax=uncultured Bacteroides sp. TaxID=162156 RepID=UPI002AABC0E6|nr:hypothetical protein [uncultured Bacteroides sp.]
MKYYLFLLVLLFLSSCGKKDNKDVEACLVKQPNNSSFMLDTINTSKWDSVYVMAPYQYVNIEKNIPYLSDKLKKKFKETAMIGSYCTLIFVKDQKVVSYSSIKRDVADFSSLDGKIGYPLKQNYQIVAYRKVIAG